MPKWNFVKSVILSVAFAGAIALADGQFFTVEGGGTSGDTPDQEMATVSGMKYHAVVQWLERYLGDRYRKMGKLVTPEFAERYILDYKVGRNPQNRALLELTGHLDADSLKQWARVIETKEGMNSLKPVFLFSSTLPGAEAAASETAAKLSASPIEQTLVGVANSAFQKFNVRVTLFEGVGLSLVQAPRSEADLKTLREQLGGGKGYHCAIWFQLSPCKSCGGSRLDTYLYNLVHARLALIRSDDLTLSTSDLANASAVRTAMRSLQRQFPSEVDAMISQGTLFSAAYHLIVQGVDNYRAFQDLEQNLFRVDYLNQCVLKRSEPGIAEFEVLTPMTADQLYLRLQKEDLAGFRLLPVRVDPQTLVVRYSK